MEIKNQKVIRHVREEWKVYRVNAIISDEKRKVPEGTWTPGGGVKMPRKSFVLWIFIKPLK